MVQGRVWCAQGNSTSLVGTAEQVAEALLDYYDLGSCARSMGSDCLNCDPVHKPSPSLMSFENAAVHAARPVAGGRGKDPGINGMFK